MNAKVTAGVTGAMGGALVGAITGYLVDKGTGAGYGAALGGVAIGTLGVLNAPSASATSTVAGFPQGLAGFFGLGSTPKSQPRFLGRRAGGLNAQLCPR